jgi:outer membrane protein assembly factor BamB
MKKWLAIGVTLLFAGTELVPVYAQTSSHIDKSIKEATLIYGNIERHRLPQHLSLTITDYNISPDSNTALESPKIVIGESIVSDWPMFGHDPFHTGRCEFVTTKNVGAKLWDAETSSWAMCSPIIANDGTIFIGAHNLCAFNSNGTLRWKINHTTVDSAPVIDERGMIYFGTVFGNNRFYAVYPNGTVAWQISFGDVIGDPVITSDGTIIVPESNDNKIVALNHNGTVKWEFPTNHVIYSSPAIGSDGSIYCGSHDGNIYALHQNGTLKWLFPTGNWVHGSPSIGDDGTVYCGSDNGYLYALNPNNGSVKWSLQIGSSYASPTIGTDGTLYIGVWEKRFYAINPDGTIKWSYDTSPGKVWGSTAALSGDGTLYFGTCDLEWSGGVELIALWTNGTVKWRDSLDSVFSSPAIDKNGTVFIGSNDEPGSGYLNAFNNCPLRVEAYGPYHSDDKEYLDFPGSIYGGIPPYSCLWDFGDGITSNEQNPNHRYSKVGIYNATFTVTDSNHTTRSDFTIVNITYHAPLMILLKPQNFIYFANVPIFPSIGPIVIGPIKIKVFILEPRLVDHVDFYVDWKLTGTDDKWPFQWICKRGDSSINRIQELMIVAYNKGGRSSKVYVNIYRLL